MNSSLTKKIILTYIDIFIIQFFRISIILILILFILSHFYCFYFYLAFIMGKDIGHIYKHSQSQISTPSIKAPFISYSASQTSSSIELTITSVSSVIYNKQTNCVFCSKNTIQNDLNITNNDDIQSCETQRKTIIELQPLQIQIIMRNVLLSRQLFC